MLQNDFILTRTGKIYEAEKIEGVTHNLDYYLDGLIVFLQLQKENKESLSDFFYYEMEVEAIKEILYRDYVPKCYK